MALNMVSPINNAAGCLDQFHHWLSRYRSEKLFSTGGLSSGLSLSISIRDADAARQWRVTRARRDSGSSLSVASFITMVYFTGWHAAAFAFAGRH